MCHSRSRGYGCHSHRSNHVGIIPLAASFIAGRVSNRSAVPIAAPDPAVAQPLAPQVNGRTYRDINDEKAPKASGQVYRYVDDEAQGAPPAYDKGSKIAIADEKDIDVLNAHFDRGMRMDDPTVMRAVYDEQPSQVHVPRAAQAGESGQPLSWWEEKRARKQERRAACHQKREERSAACHQKREERRAAYLQRKAEKNSA